MRLVLALFELWKQNQMLAYKPTDACLCAFQSLYWLDDIWRWLPLQVYIFDASVLSQSISHLILVLSRVDVADVVSGAYSRRDEGSAQTW